MSRLIPTTKLDQFKQADPWSFDPAEDHQFVFLFERNEDRTVIPIDDELHSPDHVAAWTQHALTVINEVHSHCEITYRSYSYWHDDYSERRILRPVLYSHFTGDFLHHGRLYTRKYGHQNLRKTERATIQFDGQPTIELDYSGLHTRMLYHRNNLECPDDPYALWGKKTTDYQRILAKAVVNAAINSRGTTAKERRRSTVSACNQAMNTMTQGGKHNKPKRKEGKALADAKRLNQAIQRANTTFAEVYDLVLSVHKPIAHEFGKDAGMKLMRIDSQIALDVTLHFALQRIPCLPCHDSFIVPQQYEEELKRTMKLVYRDHVGRDAKVK